MINIEEVKKIRDYLELLEMRNDRTILDGDLKRQFDILSIKYDDKENFKEILDAYNFITTNLKKVNNYINTGFISNFDNIPSNSKSFEEFEKQRKYQNQENVLAKKQQEYDEKLEEVKTKVINQIEDYYQGLNKKEYFYYDYDLITAKVKDFTGKINSSEVKTIEDINTLYHNTLLELQVIDKKAVKQNKEAKRRLYKNLLIIIPIIVFLMVFIYYLLIAISNQK